MEAHIKVCKRRNNAVGATLPAASLADDDSCGVDDTASDMQQYQNPVSEEEESSLPGQRRLNPSSSLEPRQAQKRARVPPMEGVKSGEALGEVTRAFTFSLKEKVEKDTEKELQAIESFK